MALYQYQSDGIKLLYSILTNRAERAAMLCDPPGAGKTPQAIGVLDSLNAKKTLIICPASLKENWRREIARWSAQLLTVQVLNTSSDAITDADVIVVSYHLAVRMQEEVSKKMFDFLILDEAHVCKSASSQIARTVLVTLWARCRYRLLITGTPLPNGRAVEAYTTFSRCNYGDFGSWDAFRARYCIEERTPWGVSYSRSKNLSELKEKSKGFMVRRSKEEVLQQLPGLVRQNLHVRLPQMAIFSLEKELDIDAIVNAVENEIPLEGEHITTARRKLAMLKAPRIVEAINDTLSEVGQVVVFVHHRELYNYIMENFSSIVGINGLTPSHERQYAVDIFQSGGAEIFLASLKAANTGLTLTKASHLIMAEYDWVPSVNEQAEGRIYRVSQNEICRVQYVVAADSLDEKILSVVQRKQRKIEEAIGNA